MSRKLKLYVWEDFRTDYYPGLAVAIATDIRSARRAVMNAIGHESESARADLAARPVIIPVTEDMAAHAWQVCGGG